MANAQAPSHTSVFLADFREFLLCFKDHQIRVTTLKRHIPLRHLKELAQKMGGPEPFHPLRSDMGFEMRCQRDEKRLDFMDMLAAGMGLLDRTEWGYIVPGAAFEKFLESPEEDQARRTRETFWAMDWDRLYPWGEVVDCLEQNRPAIGAFLNGCAPLAQISLGETVKKLFPDTPEAFKNRWASGLFWAVLRPLEYMDLAKGHFQKDAEGFYYPESFEINERLRLPSYP